MFTVFRKYIQLLCYHRCVPTKNYCVENLSVSVVRISPLNQDKIRRFYVICNAALTSEKKAVYKTS